MLTYSRATGFATANDFSLAAGQSFEQLDIFIIDEHRARLPTIDEQRILLLDFDLRFRPFFRKSILLKRRRSRHVLLPFSLRNISTAQNMRQNKIPRKEKFYPPIPP